jgi:hypothetical protein
MIEVINTYHVDYWYRNKIIDCGQISEELNLKSEEIATDNITDIRELEELQEYLQSNDNAKKEEETKFYDNSIKDEEDYNVRELSTVRVSQSIKESRPIYNYKREKKELPKNTRIDEFSLRKRNVLLDKFSKPKLN